MGTELSYLADGEAGYVRSFRARVVALPPGAVVLDRTYFYPVGGGQPADRGVLRLPDGSELPIADVSKSGESVLHRIGRRRGAAGAISVGLEVEGVIDWERRFRHMRLHTTQHLLSARLFSRTGRRTVRARLEGRSATLDLELPALDGVLALEEAAADLRAQLDRNLPVRIRHLPRSEYDQDPGARSGLVPLPPHVDPVRVVEIEAADRCPCGGTHLRSTSEVGPVELAPFQVLPEGGTQVRFTLGDAGLPTPTG
jgi:misacylated tRNA(Ala) deacylase